MDAFAAAATFKDSIEAFGDAAIDELTAEAGYRRARANIANLYQSRKTEIGTMLEAYSRRPWPADHHHGVRECAENALAVLDLLYRDFQRNLAILHKRG